MDFTVPAPGGAAPGAPAALAARGADPAISIPAGNHLFRRITGLVLAPIAGALVPVPTTLPQSIMEMVLGPIISAGGAIAVLGLPAILVKCSPLRFEMALTQLEAEPAGVGLNPTAVYDDLEHAASQVLEAVRRVQIQVGPINPAYIGLAGDFYFLEPIGALVAAQFVALCNGPTALTIEHLSVGGFLVHYGFLCFLCMGNSQVASRDGPGSPTRRALAQISQLAAAASLAGQVAPGALADASSLSDWFNATAAAEAVVFGRFSAVPSSREQNIRDRHTLHYGTPEQRVNLLASLVIRQPLRGKLPNVHRILGSGPTASDAASVGRRLIRLVKDSATVTMDSIDTVMELEKAMLEPVRSLSTPGVAVASLTDRLIHIENIFRKTSKGADGKSAAPSSYSANLSLLLDSASWRATEAILLAEVASPVCRPLVLLETLTNSSVLGARRLALGGFRRDDESTRLLALSQPLSRAIDILDVSNGTKMDAVRHRAVADALVADPITRLPMTAAQTQFYQDFPDNFARQILRGAVDELDWIALMRLVLQANRPGLLIQEYPQGIFDPLVPPLLNPLVDRVAQLLGVPLAAPAPPLVPPPNFATFRTIVVTVSTRYSSVNSVPDGFLSSNMVKLRKFERAAWGEAAGTFNRVMGMKDPAGPVIQSVFEANSGAMATLAQLDRALSDQATSADAQPELHALQQKISEHGSIEALVAHVAGLSGRPPSRGGTSTSMAASSSRDGDRSLRTRERDSSRDRSRSADRGRSSERGRSADRDRALKGRSPSLPRDSTDALGSRAKDIVRHGADGATFWYANRSGERASVIYEYSKLEKLAGRTRKELDFPVICSLRRSVHGRAELCEFPSQPGHEHAHSPAHIPPFSGFAEQAEALFREPSAGRAMPADAELLNRRSPSGERLGAVAGKAARFEGLSRGRSPHPGRRESPSRAAPPGRSSQQRSRSRSQSAPSRSRSPARSAPMAMRSSLERDVPRSQPQASRPASNSSRGATQGSSAAQSSSPSNQALRAAVRGSI